VKRGWSGVFVAAVVVVAACGDLSVDPDEVTAIVFDELPSPSIVAGDTLRDSTGAVAPLKARLFDAEGDEVTGPLEFFPQEPSLRVISGDLLVAESTATGNVGVLASTIGIQSVVRQVEIVEAAPDSLSASNLIVPLAWVVPDDPQQNTSQPLVVRVLSGPDSGVRSWVVKFRLEAGGRIIPENDTTQIFLVGDNGRPSYADTTDATGRASRRVRLRVVPGLIAPDSAVITAFASYRGSPLIGSPARLVLPLRVR